MLLALLMATTAAFSIATALRINAVAAGRVLAAGRLTGPAVWQAFAVLAPLCLLALSWATRVVRRAVARR